LEKVKNLEGLAKEVGIPLAQLALAWCLINPHVSTVILGASKLEQLENNLDALRHLNKVTPDVTEQIEAIVQTRPAPLPDYK
jgi:aryl-alcohol dehydrogenase-like predicted oxidoreductase